MYFIVTVTNFAGTPPQGAINPAHLKTLNHSEGAKDEETHSLTGRGGTLRHDLRIGIGSRSEQK
jgi:hypothetical protein